MIKAIPKQAYFKTLNDALEAEGLVQDWPLGLNIQYGHTESTVSNGKYISVYRDERGMYERPIHYKTQMAA